MNIFKRSAIAGLLVLSLVACGDSKEKKLEFNNKVQQEITIAGKAMQESMTAVQPKAPPANAEEAKKQVQAVKEKIDASIKANEEHITNLKKLSVPKGGEKFHQSAIDNLTTANDFLKNEVSDLLKLDPIKPDMAQAQEKMQKMMAKLTVIGTKAKELSEAQQAFAKEAGFDAAK